MTIGTRFARISITLPRELLVAADRRARELDRPRSWIVAEALRGYLSGAPAQHPAVREPANVPYGAAPGLGPYRLAQLEADLALTPEQRVREAERTARATPRRARSGHRLLLFDRYEDYLEWKRSQALTE
ncbi:MAG TPA: ribbon-helix-helix protein, CopG family [Gemmatimonadales bacterium]